jgi:glycosidase
VLAQDFLYLHPELLVAFVGNHDGPRFLTEAGGDVGKLMMAQAFVLTTRRVPHLYYGDEIAMAGEGDPDCRRDFPGGFAGDARDAFTPSGRDANQQATFESIRRAIAARRAHPALRGGVTKVLVADGPLLVLLREGHGERALVAVNAADVPRPARAELGGAFADGVRLTDALDASHAVVASGGSARLTLAPRSIAVFVDAN